MNHHLDLAKNAMITSREEDFGGVRRDMEGWQGEAANQFVDYVNQLDDSLNVMVVRIETLQMILQGHQILVKRMRDDVCDLVRKTLDGIAAAETDGWKAGLTVAGAEDELGVIVKFVDSAEGMLHAIDIERLRIEKGFQELANWITDTHLPEVRPERPVVVTAPDFQPGAFGMEEDVQAGHPVPTDNSDLVPEPKKKADGPFDQTTTDGQEHDRYPEQGPA